MQNGRQCQLGKNMVTAAIKQIASSWHQQTFYLQDILLPSLAMTHSPWIGTLFSHAGLRHCEAVNLKKLSMFVDEAEAILKER